MTIQSFRMVSVHALSGCDPRGVYENIFVDFSA
jgi:hypothetical protein